MTIRWYIDTPIKTAAYTTGNFRRLKTRLTWEIQANNWPNPQKNPRPDAYPIKEKGHSDVEATECPKKNPAGQPGSPVRLAGWVSEVPQVAAREERSVLRYASDGLSGEMGCLGKPDD